MVRRGRPLPLKGRYAFIEINERNERNFDEGEGTWQESICRNNPLTRPPYYRWNAVDFCREIEARNPSN